MLLSKIETRKNRQKWFKVQDRRQDLEKLFEEDNSKDSSCSAYRLMCGGREREVAVICIKKFQSLLLIDCCKI